MKRWLWGLVLSVILVAALGMGAAMSVAAYGPFDPGDEALYRGQRALEELLVRLQTSPKNKARQRMQLAKRRIRDVERLAGGTGESTALAELDQAVREAVRAASICPQSDAGELRLDLLSVLQNAERVLANGSTQASTEGMDTTAFERWMAGMIQLLRQPGLQLGDLVVGFNTLVNAAQGEPETSLPAPTQPATVPHPVDPHIVYFPPGSAGAKHQFYLLVGRHGEIDCTSCHPAGEYAGTGNLCVSCHETEKPVVHFPGTCELCHAPTTWTDIHFKHTSPLSDDCASCHLAARPARHYPGQCSACHSTTAWTPASFNHAVAMATDCQSCHASNRPAGHWNGQCSACHSTTAWLPATFSHSAAGATDCQSCHASSRPAGHWDGQCSACHSTGGWLPATFNHSAAGATDCVSCHEGRRPANHYGGQCSACHSTTAWIPATFNHSAAGATDCQACHNRPSGHWGSQCSSCHSTSGWTPASFNHEAAGATDCVSCHLGRRPANHYDGQCSMCHSTSAWTPANFNHSFPIDHGGANGECSTCHPSGTGSWTCFTCHNEGEMDKKHNEKGIPDYASRCLECHAGGRGGDD